MRPLHYFNMTLLDMVTYVGLELHIESVLYSVSDIKACRYM